MLLLQAGVSAIASELPLRSRGVHLLTPSHSPPCTPTRPQPHDPTVDVMMAFFKPPSDALTQQQGASLPAPPPAQQPTGAAAAVHQLAAASSTAALHGGRSLLGAILALLPQARAALQQASIRAWGGRLIPDSRAFPPPPPADCPQFIDAPEAAAAAATAGGGAPPAAVPEDEARLRELATSLLATYVDPALTMIARLGPALDAAHPRPEVRREEERGGFQSSVDCAG